MPKWLDPRLDILPAAQREAWQLLDPASALSFVLNGGTAVTLPLGLAAFKAMFRGEPAEVLRALGYGDLASLSDRDKTILRAARDRVGELPEIVLKPGSLAAEAA